MCEKQETGERHCIKTYIKERIRQGYTSRIRRFIYKLGQRLCQARIGNTLVAIQVVSTTMGLTSYRNQTFSELFDDVENSDDEPTPEYTASEEKPWNNNKVLDEIDLHDWEITQPHEDVSGDVEYGVIYGRYSSDNQDKSGCVSRIKAMLDTAEEMEVPLYTNPIVDVALTGKETDRGGLDEIVRLVQHPQVDYLFVHDVDRLARRNSFCLYMIEVFTRRSDITVITDEGELNLDTLEGLAITWVQSMAGEIENRNKAKRTLGGQIEKFSSGSYSTWFNKYKIGYKQSDEDLLEKDEKEVEIAKAMFRTFDEADEHRPYAETRDKINTQYGEVLDEELKHDPLRKMLTAPLYIGKPTVSGKSIGDQGQEAVLDKPNLKIIDEDLFERVNQKVERIKNRQSSPGKSGEVLDLDYLMFEYGLLPLVESSPDVAIHCSTCDAKMVRDGTRKLDSSEKRIPIYKCTECADNPDQKGKYKTYPNSLELYKIRLFNKILNNLDKVSQYMDLDDV